MAARLADATRTHDVLVWFCGLASPDLHVARVRARVAAGGHDILEALIRKRFPRALQHLIALMPLLAQLQVYDNREQVDAGRAVPGPALVMEMRNDRLVWPAPNDIPALAGTPRCASPLLEAALAL